MQSGPCPRVSSPAHHHVHNPEAGDFVASISGTTGDRTELCQRRIKILILSNNHSQALLVWSGELIPSDLTSFHQSPQTCSASQSPNSSRLTGFRL
jgi:hypothetical protein